MSSPISRRDDLLDRLTFWHVALFVIATAWMFGGRIYWAKVPLTIWGLLGVGLTITGFVDRHRRQRPMLRPWLWILPGLLLSGWILLATFNPNFQVVPYYDTFVFRPVDPIPWLPSAAKPTAARSELALFFGLYLSAFNIALNLNRQKQLYKLFLILAINTTLIAVMGTLQKLLGTDMFFGLQKSPNPAFFGSFIYHNHWGPFALLSLGMWLAIIPWLSAQASGRSFWHSPATAAMCAAGLIAVAIPLSTSRASTLMLGVVVLGTAAFLIRRTLHHARHRRQDPRWSLALITIGIITTVGAVYYIGSDVIHQRIAKTREQISEMRTRGTLGERATVYRTTIQIWQDKPLAGWGLESWELMHRRQTRIHRVDNLPIYYDQAHSDWLQSLAEVGVVGTTLLCATGIIPLWMTRRRLFKHVFSGSVLGIHALILLYAWIEFPLASPAVVLAFWVTFFAGLRHAQLGSRT